MVTKSQTVAAPHFNRYIEIVKEKDLLKSLKKSRKEFSELLDRLPRNKIDFAYAPGKWTIREVLQHIIDAERVFAYRALTFARKDKTPLPGFDENSWAAESRSAKRSWKELRDEFKTVRKSSELLFSSLDQDQLLAEGVAGNHPANSLAMGFVCSGHLLHHIKIIRERYL